MKSKQLNRITITIGHETKKFLDQNTSYGEITRITCALFKLLTDFHKTYGEAAIFLLLQGKLTLAAKKEEETDGKVG